MKITQNLKIFSLLTALYSVLFFYVLYESIAAHSLTMVLVSPVVFGILMWVTAWKLGSTDDQSTTRLKLGFTYHLVSYVIVNGIHAFWFTMELTPADYTFLEFIIGPASWALGLLIHFLVAQNSIKDYPKDKVFD